MIPAGCGSAPCSGAAYWRAGPAAVASIGSGGTLPACLGAIRRRHQRYAPPRSPLRLRGLCRRPFALRPAPVGSGLRPPCGVGRLRPPPRLPASASRREAGPVARAGALPRLPRVAAWARRLGSASLACAFRLRPVSPLLLFGLPVRSPCGRRRAPPCASARSAACLCAVPPPPACGLRPVGACPRSSRGGRLSRLGPAGLGSFLARRRPPLSRLPPRCRLPTRRGCFFLPLGLSPSRVRPWPLRGPLTGSAPAGPRWARPRFRGPCLSGAVLQGGHSNLANQVLTKYLEYAILNATRSCGSG